jgi:hypothetical protein
MALRRNRFCAMLCVLAVAHAAAVFRCDACESGACGSGRAGCCGGMTAAETQCPLCKAEADSECDGRQAQDSVPCGMPRWTRKKWAVSPRRSSETSSMFQARHRRLAACRGFRFPSDRCGFSTGCGGIEQPGRAFSRRGVPVRLVPRPYGFPSEPCVLVRMFCPQISSEDSFMKSFLLISALALTSAVPVGMGLLSKAGCGSCPCCGCCESGSCACSECSCDCCSDKGCPGSDAACSSSCCGQAVSR